MVFLFQVFASPTAGKVNDILNSPKPTQPVGLFTAENSDLKQLDVRIEINKMRIDMIRNNSDIGMEEKTKKLGNMDAGTAEILKILNNNSFSQSTKAVMIGKLIDDENKAEIFKTKDDENSGKGSKYPEQKIQPRPDDEFMLHK